MRNPTYEQELDKQGVEWVYAEKIPISKINVRKGLQNQARLEIPLDEHIVDQYAQARKDGAKFPPLVLIRRGPSYHVLDGNQRIASAVKVGCVYHDAYLVISQDQMIVDRIAWSFNNHVNGARLSYADSLAHAISFVRRYGVTIRDASKEWGVPDHAVKKAVKVLDLRDKILAADVKGATKLHESTIGSLSFLETVGDDILIAGAKVVAATGATSEDINELNKRVREAKDHAKKMEVIEEFGKSEWMQARRAETKGGTIKRRQPLPRDQIVKQITALLRLVEEFDRKAFHQATKADTKEAAEKAYDLVVHLNVIFGLGTASQREEKVG